VDVIRVVKASRSQTKAWDPGNTGFYDVALFEDIWNTSSSPY